MAEKLHDSYIRLMQALKLQGMDRKQFDADMELESSVVSNWRTRGIPPAQASKAARVSHTTVEWLLHASPPDETRLTDDEKRLIRSYRKMNKQQHDSLHDYATFLVFMTSNKSEREQLARDAVLDTREKRK